MKTCRKCKHEKPLEDYHLNKTNPDGLENRCKQCRKEEAYKRYQKNWFKMQVKLKKRYSELNGLAFNLDEEYLESIYNGRCAITGRPFVKHDKTSDDCPHLDRIVPEKGYTKGNVKYICARLNRIKYNATCDELKKLLEYMS